MTLLATMALAQAPATVIHIINVKWKVDATPEQIKAVVDAVQQLPARYPGLRRVRAVHLGDDSRRPRGASLRGLLAVAKRDSGLTCPTDGRSTPAL